MSEYLLSHLPTLPSHAVQEAKENRRKVLDGVRERRKMIYQRYEQKQRLQATSKI